MDYKKKRKTEQTIFGILVFLGFAAVGACVGFFLGVIEKYYLTNMNAVEFFAVVVSALALIFLSYYINVDLHEIGHMIFGLLTGYQFHSLRFGKIMLVKKDDKLHFCRFHMPGTGGQCIMSAPACDAEKMPVVLYNLGGLIVNFVLFVVGICVFCGMRNSIPIAGMIGLIFALTALILLISNGIPFTQLGTDGANAIILYKDKNARAAFRNQMEVVKYLANNYSVLEMPEELFLFDSSVPMTNPLITSQAVSYYNYLSANKKYSEAKKMASFILENTKSINRLHEMILYGELIFISAVIDKDKEAAAKQFKAHEKELNAVSGFISIQRVLYAYYTLVEIDEKKAAAFAKRFESSVKNYPYPKDAAIEKEEFDMVAEVLADSNLKNKTK